MLNGIIIVNGIYGFILKMFFLFLFFRVGKFLFGLYLDVVKGDKLIEVWRYMFFFFFLLR